MQIQFFDPRKNCIWLFFRFLRFCKLSRSVEPSNRKSFCAIIESRRSVDSPILGTRDLPVCRGPGMHEPPDRRTDGRGATRYVRFVGSAWCGGCRSGWWHGMGRGGWLDQFGVPRDSGGSSVTRGAVPSGRGGCGQGGSTGSSSRGAVRSLGPSVRREGGEGPLDQFVAPLVVSTRRPSRRPNRTNKKKGVTICLPQTDSS